jgi:hypothetical protein
MISGQKIILDRDLSELYGVETKQLKRAVRRNLDRFPDDFMIAFTREEYLSLRRRIGTLKRGQHSKYMPFAFTDQGVDSYFLLDTFKHISRYLLFNMARPVS